MSQIVVILMAKFTGQSCGNFQPGGYIRTCPVTPLPFEDHPNTQAHAFEISLRKRRPVNHWQ